jgi:transcriptional regulator with XRE-family HTH domain
MRPPLPSDHPLRAWRIEHKLSLEDLAKEAGTTGATLSRIERGKQFPHPQLLRRLCNTTEIGVEPFFEAMTNGAPPTA